MCVCDIKVKRDEEHKAVKSKDVKDEEVARIPIAFAMVKLMQTLPPHIMEVNLPGYAAVCVCVCEKEVFRKPFTGVHFRCWLSICLKLW